MNGPVLFIIVHRVIRVVFVIFVYEAIEGFVFLFILYITDILPNNYIDIYPFATTVIKVCS